MSGNHFCFENCDDTALVAVIKAQNSDSDAAFETMCARYMGLISSVSKKYLYCSKEYELSDFLQEGLIGLLCACKTYDGNSKSTFKNYAILCVENRFRSVLRRLNKKASIPTGNLISIDDSLSDLQDPTRLSMQEILESKEYIKSMYSKIEKTLSKLEKDVLSLYLSGYSYQQSATVLSVSEKTIDNALCRIRKKLSK